jgi:hypothetical protein
VSGRLAGKVALITGVGGGIGAGGIDVLDNNASSQRFGALG